MAEAAILLALIVVMAGVGLGCWRLVRGPARGRLRLVGRVGLLSLVSAAAVSYSFWKLINSRGFQLFGGIIPRVETSEKVVALTFDDGPTPEATGPLLSVLAQRGVKATFFPVGAELERHPDLGRRIAGGGHELGNHTFSHDRVVMKSLSYVRDEIERTDALVRATGYEGPIYFRPPYGKKFVLLPYYLRRTGRKTITWDVDPDSNPRAAVGADKVTAYVLEHTRPGSIILLHVMYKGRESSLQAVPSIIDNLKQRGYRFVTVSELLSGR